MNNFLPLTPAQSWALIGMVFLGVLLFTYLIYVLDQIIATAVWNVKIVGAKGVLYALGGYEAYEILRERVIEVTSKNGLYHVTSSDRETNYRYVIIPSKIDWENPDYAEAIRLAGDNEKLRKNLLPESRVKNYFQLKNKETGEKTECFVAYLKYDTIKEVEEAMNRLFDEEYYEACKEARKKSA